MLTTVPLRRATPTRASTRCPTRSALERRPGGAGLPAPGARLPRAGHRRHAARAARLPLSARPLHVVVATREEEEQAPHPLMGASTGELVRRLRDGAAALAAEAAHARSPCPGRGARRTSSTGRCAPRRCASCWATRLRPGARVRGRERRRLAARPRHLSLDRRRRAGRAAARLAYQGVTLSLANFDRLDIRGRICAIQQSSIFIRVSIARLINEVKRVRCFAALAGALAAAGPRWSGPSSSSASAARRSASATTSSCGSTRCRRWAASPPRAPPRTPRSATRWAPAASSSAPLPMLELTDLPETTREGDPAERALVQGRARRRAVPARGLAGRADRVQPRPARPPRRQQGRRVAHRRARLSRHGLPRLAPRLSFRAEHPCCSRWASALPTISLGAHDLGRRHRHPGPDRGASAPTSRARSTSRRTSFKAKFWGTFRCQTYWLLATRGAWRVLWSLARTGRYEPAKTDRVSRPAHRHVAEVRGLPGPARAGQRRVVGACARWAACQLTGRGLGGTVTPVTAGWSSPVARWAHNPKVVGSNPTPATTAGTRG